MKRATLMRSDMGFLDRLFGKRVTIHLPMPDGSVRMVKVTTRWLEHMRRQGKIKPVGGRRVRVHILDPTGACLAELIRSIGDANGLANEALDQLGITGVTATYRLEEWTVGKDVSAADYNRWADSESGDLHVIIAREQGGLRRSFADKGLWQQARRMMESI